MSRFIADLILAEKMSCVYHWLYIYRLSLAFIIANFGARLSRSGHSELMVRKFFCLHNAIEAGIKMFRQLFVVGREDHVPHAQPVTTPNEAA